MALIVLLRGINVGGYRTFRPSMLASDLAAYDVVNVGTAGTLVVRKPLSAPSSLLNCVECRLKRQFHSAKPVTLFDWKWRVLLGLSH